MSDQSPFPPQDVNTGNDMDDWFSMLSCIVNFLSAASNLAIKLEQNYLISNVTNLRKPALPLLPAPPLAEEEIEELPIASTPLEDVCTLIILPQQSENIEEPAGDESGIQKAAEEYVLLSQQTPIPLTYPESECSELPQEAQYLNTQHMGDYSSTNIPREFTGYYSKTDQLISYAEDAHSSFCNADQPDETIKICSSEDICYFDDFTDSEQTIDSNNSKHYNPPVRSVTSEDVCGTSNEREDEAYSTPPGFVEDKCVQAQRKSGETLPKDTTVKVIKSQEIQTQSTNRFKDRVMELITKSPELQQPIKDSIVEKVKTPKENSTFKQNTVPKNLNELREQLDSINKLPTSKQVVKEDNGPQGKRCPLKSSRIPVDKNSSKKGKKTEKSTVNVPDSAISKHIPLKSPGTTKRFASVESVVKKLIHSSKTVEKEAGENKDSKKEQKSVKKPTVQKEKIDEESNPVMEHKFGSTGKKEYPQKEIKTVKNHNDFIYKKYVPPKSEKPNTANSRSRPATKRTPSRKPSEDSTARSRSQSRARPSKNTSASVETTRKKEREVKRALSPTSQKVKN